MPNVLYFHHTGKELYLVNTVQIASGNKQSFLKKMSATRLYASAASEPVTTIDRLF